MADDDNIDFKIARLCDEYEAVNFKSPNRIRCHPQTRRDILRDSLSVGFAQSGQPTVWGLLLIPDIEILPGDIVVDNI